MSDIIQDIYKLDCRKIDLSVKKHKDTLDAYTKYCIDIAEAGKINSRIYLIMGKCEMYYEGNQIPVGVSSDLSGDTSNTILEFVKNNWDTNRIDTTKFWVKKSRRNQIFHVDNKITDVVDGFISEYAVAEKSLTIDNEDDPKYDNIAKVIRKKIEKMENKTDKQVWTMVRLPSIENFALYGLGWDKIDFNHRINVPYGDLEYEYIHPRDIDVDPNCQMKYFQDARFLVRRRRLELNDAKAYLKAMGNKDWDKVQPDNDYQINDRRKEMRNNMIDTQQFVTFYEFYYRKVYTEKGVINKEPKIQILEDVDYKEDNIYYFNSIYNKDLGTIQHWTSPYIDRRNHKIWQFNLFPYCGRQSRVRLYPVSIIERLLNLQDIINVTESLILDNARQKSLVRMLISKAVYDKEGKGMMGMLQKGGMYPVSLPEGTKLSDLMHEIKIADLPPSIETFLELSLESIKRQGVRQEPLEGRLPEKGSVPSGIAISKLQKQNRQMLSGFDTNIEWAVTQEGNFVYKVLAEEFTEEDWMRVQDKQKEEPGYIPINGVFGMDEYLAYLQKTYPNDDIAEAGRKYAMYNDVHIHYQMTGTNGEKLSYEEIKKGKTIVYVNFLKNIDTGEKFDLDIKVTVNFDSEANKMENLVQANQDFASGNLTYEMLLKMRGGWWEAKSEEILEKRKEEKQILQYGEEVLQRGGDFLPAFNQFLQQYDMNKQKEAKIKQGVDNADTRNQVKQITEPQQQVA